MDPVAVPDATELGLTDTGALDEAALTDAPELDGLEEEAGGDADTDALVFVEEGDVPNDADLNEEATSEVGTDAELGLTIKDVETAVDLRIEPDAVELVLVDITALDDAGLTDEPRLGGTVLLAVVDLVVVAVILLEVCPDVIVEVDFVVG